MIKRFLTVLFSAAILWTFALPANAQMSDDAVVAYVKNGMASGKSQNEMIKELAARGVTRAQAERLKERFENEQSGRTEAARTVGTQERERRTNDGLAEVEAGSLDMVATEIANPEDLSTSAAARLVFGRNIFTNRNLTFAPSMNIPTPENYKLGPGDEVIIDIWGTNQATIRQTISPEGTINVQDIGLVNLNGMTVKEADAYMRRMLGRIYSVYGDDAASEIKLTLGNIRTIQVNMMGEVAVPGTYYVSSFSNIYHALHRAGGVSNLGSLREIHLMRKGKKISTIDIYEFILKGKSFEDITLEEGDIIIVPTYKTLVDISGNIKRPMFYELKENETIADLLEYAGGFSGDAFKDNLRLIRQNGREYKVFTINKPDYSSFTLMDGDALTIGAMLDRFENRIEIKGAVYRPGVYELGNEISTVRQLVEKAEGIKGDAFTNRALLQREKEDLTLETQALDIAGILNGTLPDVPLCKNDILYIASIHDLKDLGYISVSGPVANPGRFIYAENTTLEDIIMQAGGLLESASSVRVDVSRRVKNPTSLEETDTLSYNYTFSLKDGFVIDGEPNFILQPYDQVYVRRSPGYQEQSHVSVSGRVLFAGNYALSNVNERISDVINKAGGVMKNAFVKGARLSRIISQEDRMRMRATLQMMDNAKDSIDVSELDFGNRYYIGINLEEALANPGSDADIVLQPGDEIYVPEYQNTVKISGSVLYPNSVTYRSDMRVKDYIEMAGGYGFEAKKKRAFIVYMNGTVAKAKKNSKKIVEPGCEIIIPQKRKNPSNLQDILAISTTSASLATMIATVGNIITK
ncbi:MAG: SLBB domain-containing protein [Bacteroidaceae bacterium]|nr:SLBB domain-containing protein [Bacteroidaceae bacterium]